MIYAVMWHPDHRRVFRQITYTIFLILLIGMNIARVHVAYDQSYSTKEDVAAYIYTYNRLPSNYIVKQSFDLVDGENIYFYDVFNNNEGLLPNDGYMEAYINATKTDLGSERLVFSDTTVYYTEDHYLSFEEITWFSLFGLHLVIRALFWIVNFSVIAIVYYSIKKRLISWTVLFEDLQGDVKRVKIWFKRLFQTIRQPFKS